MDIDNIRRQQIADLINSLGDRSSGEITVKTEIPVVWDGTKWVIQGGLPVL